MERGSNSPSGGSIDGRILRITNGILIGAILSAFCSFGTLSAAWGYRSLLSSPVFVVREVKVSGALHDSLQEEARRIEMALIGKNLLGLDIEGICSDIQRHPWVAEVSLKKELPNGLDIRLTERKPMVVVEVGEGAYLMDHQGELFLRVKKEEARGFLLLTGLNREDIERSDPLIQRLMWDAVGLQPYLKDKGLDEFECIRIQRGTGLTLISPARGISAIIGTHDFQNRLDRLKTVMRLNDDPRFARLISIDLRYGNQAVMRIRENKESTIQGKG